MEDVMPLSPPESLTSPISRRVQKLNKLLKSLNLVYPYPTSKPSCLEEELGLERLFEEIENEEVEEEKKRLMRNLRRNKKMTTYNTLRNSQQRKS
ncbi:hypothetical protein Tco_1511353 [Tanacetum coccineum]